MESISKRKVFEALIRLILSASFLTLTAFKVYELLLEEIGVSLHTEKRDVEIPTMSICFESDNINKMEEITPSNFIASTIITMYSVRNGTTAKIIQNEDWKQFFYTTYQYTPVQIWPCFYLDSPISTIQHPDFAKVVLTFFFGSI